MRSSVNSRGWRPLLSFFILLLCSPLGELWAQARCEGTRFACEVEEAINRGLEYTRQRGENLDQHNFLGALSFLEKRQGIGWNGPIRGYLGMSLDDQLLVENYIRQIIQREDVLRDPANIPVNYRAGGSLMALTVFHETEGPEDVGAAVTVTQAIANGIVGVQAQQGREPPYNDGGWNYGRPESGGGDLSVTQFAVAGLSAAENIIEGANSVFPRLTNYLAASQSGNGGLKYRPRSGLNSAMTASGLWCYRLAEVPVEEEGPQGALEWLRANYRYDSMVGSHNPRSTFYYFWAAEKALTVSEDTEDPNVLTGLDFADRDPAALGYPEEVPTHYFDFAYTLLQWQNPANGQWGAEFGGSPTGWTPLSSHHFAILTLERALGGVCLDIDDDGFCGADDNCPEIPNPDQLDEDLDGVGDACDNCPKIINRGQDDLDGDLLGDACDRYICVPDGQPEICDGIDNDCDNLIDVLPDGSSAVPPEACDTGLVGACAVGQQICDGFGEIDCRPLHRPQEERCDGVDDDCDGQIDEGSRNACGYCGEAPEERCDGEDNDCDGRVDEQFPNRLCEGEARCVEGECAPPCAGRPGEPLACPTGYYCADEGRCLSLCAGVYCLEGQRCRPETGVCFDLCEGVECPEGERCLEGSCLEESCENFGCEEGRRCLDSFCVEDPCAGIDCGDGAFCREGECILSCASISCPYAHHCFDGRCVSDRCGGLVCAEGERCLNERCQEDPCDPESCEEGERCIEGRCARDPCRWVECPALERSELIDDQAQCVAAWVEVEAPDATPPAPFPEWGAPVSEEDQGVPTSDQDLAPLPEDRGAQDASAPSSGGDEKEGCQTGAGTSSLWLIFCLVALVAQRRRRFCS